MLLNLPSMLRLRKAKKMDEIDDEDVINIRNEMQRILKNIYTFKNNKNSARLIEEILYQFLLTLSELRPINLNDPITFDEIDPADVVYISTGHQFDIYQIERLNRNVFTGCAFSLKDRKHIESVIKSKILKPCIKMELFEKLISDEFLFNCSIPFLYCYTKIIKEIFNESDNVYRSLMFLNLNISGLSGAVITLSCFKYVKSYWEEWKRSRQESGGSNQLASSRIELEPKVSRLVPVSRPGLFLEYCSRQGEVLSSDVPSNTRTKNLS